MKEPGFFKTSEALFGTLESGKKPGAYSSIMFGEVLSVSTSEGSSNSLRQFVDHFGGNLAEVPANREVCLLAASLRKDHKLKLPDAIHLASAIHIGAKTFVSPDKQLLKVARKYMRVVDLGQRT